MGKQSISMDMCNRATDHVTTPLTQDRLENVCVLCISVTRNFNHPQCVVSQIFRLHNIYGSYVAAAISGKDGH